MGIFFKDLVSKTFPGLQINKFKKIGEGDTYVAFLINDHYLLKQAKTGEARHKLKKEVLLMQSLTHFQSIAIPCFTYVSPDYHFGAYEMLPGIPLNECIGGKKFTTRHGEQIISFLATLHATDPATVKNCMLPVMNHLEEYKEDFKFLKNTPIAFFSKKQREIILEKYEGFLSCKKNFEYKPVLLHNDFSFNHIICNSISGNITGVIDFGDAAYGDAAYDFIFIYDLPSNIFIEDICKIYPKCDDFFINRINFYSFANLVQQLISCLMEKNNQLIIEQIKNIKNWLVRHEQNVDF